MLFGENNKFLFPPSHVPSRHRYGLWWNTEQECSLTVVVYQDRHLIGARLSCVLLSNYGPIQILIYISCKYSDIEFPSFHCFDKQSWLIKWVETIFNPIEYLTLLLFLYYGTVKIWCQIICRQLPKIVLNGFLISKMLDFIYETLLSCTYINYYSVSSIP